MAAEQAWYVAERAEALATLFLTRRGDVEVLPAGRYRRDTDYDLLVRIVSDQAAPEMTFGIEVKGTRSTKRPSGNAPVGKDMPEAHYVPGLPICSFFFAVDAEQGYYRWRFEPVISPQGTADLRPGTTFAPLDDRAIDTIIEQVKGWYATKR